MTMTMTYMTMTIAYMTMTITYDLDCVRVYITCQNFLCISYLFLLAIDTKREKGNPNLLLCLQDTENRTHRRIEA